MQQTVKLNKKNVLNSCWFGKRKKKKGIKNRTTLQGDWKTVCNQTSWEELRGPESLEDKSEEAVW